MLQRRMTLVLTLLLAFALALGGVATAQTTTEMVYWWLLPGASNQGKTCAFLDDIYAHPDTVWTEFKIDPPAAGTFSSGPLTVTISNLTPTSFDFTANIGIDAVMVKDGIDGASFFVYDGLTAPMDGATDPTLGVPRTVEVMLDTGLTTPGTRAISHISFCYDTEEPPIVKWGHKWHDLNADGVWDMDEPPLSDWEIYVDYNDNGAWDMGEPYDITRPDGYYEIVGIMPGTWKVREVGQDGWFCSFPTTSDMYGCYHEEVFEPGITYPDNNFGNYQLVSVTACKVEDVDGDPATSDDRIPVEGWTVYLIKDGVRQAPDQLTGEDGCYTWTDLMPGYTYGVGEEVPANWFPWTPTEWDFGPAQSGDEFSYTFINSEYATKSGYKWNDLNMDGIWDMDEPVLSGWTIDLLYDGMVVASAVTDEFGMYEFDMVMPGQTYLVCEVLEPGWTQTYPTMDSGGVACPMGYGPYGYEITLLSGQVETDNNFGNWRSPGCTYTLGYWKTHSSYGPAPADPRWYTDVTPLGPDTPFFASGQTWYQTFMTNPVGGNAYYLLAHQWMAAMLNVENGADPTALGTTLMDAEALLAFYSPTRTIPRTSPDRALAIQYAYTLDLFNNGMLPGGPAHCDETVLKADNSARSEPALILMSSERSK